MKKSNLPIIKHIPDFLDYCEVEKGLADRTQENYQHYLNKLVSWLKKTKKETLLPHDLTSGCLGLSLIFKSLYRQKGPSFEEGRSEEHTSELQSR